MTIPWWILIPLAAILVPVITKYLESRSRLRELEMRQGFGPEIEDIDKKLDQVLAKLDRLEKQDDEKQ
ncbi:hypothetical protein J32TS2_03980 [Shouchella clausii]|uniref:Uncharacterized protein n=3 Tax=Shouchella TaxID=2893057 RepID=Q5WCR5_SHOC1|nr:hypothetical protein [Shouchella clausii]MCM3312952.1 hypothetical protein [Psychrobacillus sp. MER TA 17]KKI87068.1 hypothetical protein WZ76_07350 [Shouchella clausii]MBX0319218.1 hypothetical protein [Shouchella clausii]MDO7284162.1 hypothetical protein [Shouchella clausii]MDO7304257.1 hypothetical protein [Shouchella clausii]